MKKLLKILGVVIALLVVIGIIAIIYLQIKWSKEAESHLALLGDEAPTLTLDGLTFRDLNKNSNWMCMKIGEQKLICELAIFLVK